MERKKLKFKKIDAFCDGISSGNPAGAIYLEEELSNEEMLKVAYQMKGYVSEVVYVKTSKSLEYDYEFSYFSCEREVEFCGHGTLAVMYDLISGSKERLNKEIIKINTKKGILEVYNKIKEEDAVYISAPMPKYIKCELKKEEIAYSLGLKEEELDDKFSFEIVNTGQNVLIVKVKSSDICINCNPDYEIIRKYCIENEIEVVNIFSDDTVFSENSYRVRVFAPTFGYLEDPATGSANTSLGYYLRDKKLWNGTAIKIEQGNNRENPNIINLANAIGESSRVMFGGKADIKIEGYYYLNK